MKKAVIAWGRMNPPTIGHEKLVNRVAAVAKREGGEPKIYLSHTQNPKKDPLQYRDKIKYAQRAFGNIVKPSTSRTIIELMKELQNAGYKQVTVVAGSDRVPEYNKLLQKYNGKDYTFDKIKIVSAGERDPDAEGVSGMSATKVRQAAANGDMELFQTGTPSKLSKRDVTDLYNKLRKGMLVEEIEKMIEKKKKEKKVDSADFSDTELKKAVDTMNEEELDEDIEELEERAPLTIQQRMKKSRQMKRLAPRMKRLRQIKKFRMAPVERLQMRARKLAKNLLRKKFAGNKGGKYASLSPSEKITVDRLVANKGPVIDRLAKRMLPMMRKKEIARIRQARQTRSEGIEKIIDDVSVLFEKTQTRQDPDIKDREGTQPVRYHSGLSKVTKAVRDAQFKRQTKMASDDPRAYNPAPGDATAKTKPSKYTKMYKNMFGEGEAEKAARERIRREKEQTKRRHDSILDRARTQDTRVVNRKEEFELTEKSMEALKTKASKSGYSYGTLKKVYDRGVAAWRTGHRPGTTPQQWGYARVNAFIAKQKSGQKLNHDTDLANEYVPEEAPTIGGVKMKKLGSGKPGSYTNLVRKHLGARAAQKLDKTDGNALVAKGKKTGNKDLVRKGSFIRNVIAKEEVQIEKGAGIGRFMTASDFGFKFEGAFDYHPSVQEEGGAGEEGTKKLKDKYKEETPGE
jgi:nicotinic acid mononucleotide adenylyltransferase